MKNKKILIFLIIGLFFSVGNASAVTCPEVGSWDGSSGVCIPTGTDLPDPGGEDPLADVINNVMQWLLGIVGVIAIIAFVISGMQYMLASGDQNMMEMGKRNMMWSIVGVIVALMGMVILIFIQSMLS
ncbi:MAG: hypothetical protein ACD_7C00030G0004 [uncultured bacterium]|nr:MAG: hypothetical protein ACD_7C00030G0004 [uncultured bacterium]HBR79024.1 hypothetical protein [Candidatus Moranbacteria bacterium]